MNLLGHLSFEFESAGSSVADANVIASPMLRMSLSNMLFSTTLRDSRCKFGCDSEGKIYQVRYGTRRSDGNTQLFLKVLRYLNALYSMLGPLVSVVWSILLVALELPR